MTKSNQLELLYRIEVNLVDGPLKTEVRSWIDTLITSAQCLSCKSPIPRPQLPLKEHPFPLPAGDDT